MGVWVFPKVRVYIRKINHVINIDFPANFFSTFFGEHNNINCSLPKENVLRSDQPRDQQHHPRSFLISPRRFLPPPPIS